MQVRARSLCGQSECSSLAAAVSLHFTMMPCRLQFALSAAAMLILVKARPFIWLWPALYKDGYMHVSYEES